MHGYWSEMQKRLKLVKKQWNHLQYALFLICKLVYKILFTNYYSFLLHIYILLIKRKRICAVDIILSMFL